MMKAMGWREGERLGRSAHGDSGPGSSVGVQSVIGSKRGDQSESRRVVAAADIGNSVFRSSSSGGGGGGGSDFIHHRSGSGGVSVGAAAGLLTPVSLAGNVGTAGLGSQPATAAAGAMAASSLSDGAAVAKRMRREKARARFAALGGHHGSSPLHTRPLDAGGGVGGGSGGGGGGGGGSGGGSGGGGGGDDDDVDADSTR